MSGIRPYLNLIVFMLLLCIACLLCSDYAFAGKKSAIAVVYPKMREPYRSIFLTILKGVKSSATLPVKAFELEEKTDPTRLHAWVDKHNVETVVALGKRGFVSSEGLPKGTKRILGAVLVPPESGNYSGGIALTPSPERLFQMLKKLSPTSETITVVYHKPLNGWLIKYAQNAAKDLGLKLNALEAADLREAATLYKNLLQEVDETHAIWLLQDNKTVDQRSILPMLLKNSWSKRFIVFSSNPAHVQRGVLFSLYPDNEAMGGRLGELASVAVGEESVKNSVMEPLQELLIAVNLRTADHLKLMLSNEDRDSFNLTFPPSR